MVFVTHWPIRISSLQVRCSDTMSTTQNKWHFINMQEVRGRFLSKRIKGCKQDNPVVGNQSVVIHVKALSKWATAVNIPKIILHISEPLNCAEML